MQRVDSNRTCLTRTGRSRHASWLVMAHACSALAVALVAAPARGADAPPAATRAVADASGRPASGDASPATAQPATAQPATAQPATSPAAAPDRGLFQVDEGLGRLPPAVQVIAIVGSTLISEDLTCIAVGMLIHHDKLSWGIGGVACFLGIYVGDLLFFLIGRLAGARVLRLRFFSRSLGPERLRQFGEWFDRRPWAAIAACRILPGLRVPLYVTVGAVTTRTAAFFWWTCFFAFVWTPALIALVVLLGDAFTRPFEWVTGTREGWLSIVLGIATIYLLVRTVILLSTGAGRAVLHRRVTWPLRVLGGGGGANGRTVNPPSDVSGRAE